MHRRFVEICGDPQTGESLTLHVTERDGDDVVEGFLRSSRNSYPIIRGIPRFAGSEHYTQNFGWQWNKWPRVQFESENVGRPMQGHTRNMWEKITGVVAPS